MQVLAFEESASKEFHRIKSVYEIRSPDTYLIVGIIFNKMRGHAMTMQKINSNELIIDDIGALDFVI